MKERHIRRKTKQWLTTCIILITTAMTATAQSDDWEELMQEMAEELASEESEGSEWAAQMEELSDLHDHPLDINTAVRRETADVAILRL